MAYSYTYKQTIFHRGLNKSKTISAPTKSELMYKIELQQNQWNEQWNKKMVAEQNRRIAEQKRIERSMKALSDEQSKNHAAQLTSDAEMDQHRISEILNDSIIAKPFNPELLKDRSKFSKKYPQEPRYAQIRNEPLRTDAAFNSTPSFFIKHSAKKMKAFIKANDDAFAQAHWIWQKEAENIRKNNQQLFENYKEAITQWNKEKNSFDENQKKQNEFIEEFLAKVSKKEKEAVEDYVSIILNRINIPVDYESEYDVEYVEENKSLTVDAVFPTVDKYPKLKSVTFIKTRQEFKESFYTDAQVKKKYDEMVYNMVLAYLNYLFKINDYFDIIESITLNGIVNTVDKTTGHDISVCILSVRINKEDFSVLNLSAIDSKAWFRSSKGIAAAAISNITPVKPIQLINKEDKRFVEGYNVVDSLNEGDNLAAIEWMDFENLIREVFSEEFSGDGSEVKVTQASRDGGVDAIAFDADPIRGGKIVIQAKRYTNVVGVSAVRDLYGTLINEGAMKGILVTTSYYGNDAYEFAKDKPIQLIDGAGLLGLMEKHGHKARIDLQEAKKILKLESNL